MASYYFRNTGDVNWGTASNWSATDGGGATGAVPTATDNAFFSNNSGNCTVNTSARVCLSLDFTKGTGYVNTITMTQSITVSGGVILNGAMGIAGANSLAIIGTGNMTSNGKTWPNNLLLSGNTKVSTFTDAWTISGNLTQNGPNGHHITLQANMTVTGNLVTGITTTTQQINGAFNLSIGGNLTVQGSTGNTTGSATLIMNGTGSWTTTSSGTLGNNLTFNTAGTITISSTVRYGTGTITYTAGTMNLSGSLLVFQASCTSNLSGVTFATIQFQGTSTVHTLSSNLNCSVGLNLAGTTAVTLNGNTINASGNITQTSTSIITGTTNIVMNGTGTWSNSSTGQLRNNLTFNTAGTITLSGNLYYNTGTITYTAGTIVLSGTTLNISVSTTLATNGMSWQNINTSGVTITLSSNLTLTGNLVLGNAVGSAIMNGNTCYVAGSVSLLGSNTGGATSGTTVIVMNGTGTLGTTNGAGTTGASNIVQINTAGIVTIGDYYANATVCGIQYIAGTVVCTGTLHVGTCTLDLGGITLNNFYIDRLNTAVVTLTTGFVIAGLFYCVGMACSILSSSAGVQRIVTLLYTGTQNIGELSATDIDSSAGQTIWSFRGVLSNTLNWNILTAPQEILLTPQGQQAVWLDYSDGLIQILE